MNTEKTYIGDKDDNGSCRILVSCGEATSLLRHIAVHSPTDFNWGYGGAGPSDTAISILCDHFDERPTAEQIKAGDFKASNIFQLFKRQYVVNFASHWELTTSQIQEWLYRQTDPEVIDAALEFEVNGESEPGILPS